MAELKPIKMLLPHETIKLEDGTEVMRVPGGYLYTKHKCTVFVKDTYEPAFDKTHEQQKQYLDEMLSRNLGPDWTKADKNDILDVLVGDYLPF